MRVLAALLLCASAYGQLVLYVAPPGQPETPFSGVYDMGSIAVAESSGVRLRLRNLGQTSVNLTFLYVAGSGFSMTGEPSMPFLVASGMNVDFTIRFAPSNSGAFSANLQINGSGYLLRGTGLPGITLRSGAQDVATGAAIDFGRVERGDKSTVALTLVNTTSDLLTIERLSVEGAGFSMDTTGPLRLSPGASVPFLMTWVPAASGIGIGALTVDQRTFRLSGTCYEPTMPRPLVSVDTPVMRSGQQGRVSVRLASVSRAYATGQLRMELRPDGNVKDNDAAAMFSTGSRTITFNVSPGDDVVRLRGENSVMFQTGTTAGTIVFVVEAGGFTEQGQVSVAVETVRVDKVQASRSANAINVTLSGFDNSRTLKQADWTFYSGAQPIAGMPLRTAVDADFDRWWTASTLGGIFQLKASFPVTGDASKVTGVDVTLTNRAGSVTTERVQF